jgi:hypothetical protein
MGWRKGDLGRFKCESPSSPRFEIVGPKSQTVLEIWYDGSPKSQELPLRTLLHDCTNTWELQKPVPVPVPLWLKEGAQFEFRSEAPSLRQNEVRDARDRLTSVFYLELSNQTLQIRRIRRDYCSCNHHDKLVMVPLHLIAEFGFVRMTRWEHILNEDNEKEPEDDYEGLFKDFEDEDD